MEIRRANGMLVGSRGKLPTRKGQLLLRHLTIITRSRDTAQHTNKYHFRPPSPEIAIHLPTAKAAERRALTGSCAFSRGMA